MNPVLAHVLDNKLLYPSKSRPFSLDSTCAYCYWPGTGGHYFPIAKLQGETNMADSHSKTDLVRSITHHHSLSYNCILSGLRWSFFLLAITQSHFPLNTQASHVDVLRLSFGPLTGPYSTLTFEALSFAVNHSIFLSHNNNPKSFKVNYFLLDLTRGRRLKGKENG